MSQDFQQIFSFFVFQPSYPAVRVSTTVREGVGFCFLGMAVGRTSESEVHLGFLRLLQIEWREAPSSGAVGETLVFRFFLSQPPFAPVTLRLSCDASLSPLGNSEHQLAPSQWRTGGAFYLFLAGREGMGRLSVTTRASVFLSR